jgi:hypothetical protein
MLVETSVPPNSHSTAAWRYSWNLELSGYIEICLDKRDYDLPGNTQLAFVEDAEIETIDGNPLAVGALSCFLQGYAAIPPRGSATPIRRV